MTHDEAKMIFDLIGFGTSDRDLVQIFCDFSRVVAEAEREACADMVLTLTCMGNAKECFEVAATYIRARGQQ